MRSIGLDGVFVAGRDIRVVVAGKAGGVRQEVAERDLVLARVGIGERRERRHDRRYLRLRRKRRAFEHHRAQDHRENVLLAERVSCGRSGLVP